MRRIFTSIKRYLGFGETVKKITFKGKDVVLPGGRWKDISLDTRFDKPVEEALKRAGGKKRVLMKYEFTLWRYGRIPEYIIVTPKFLYGLKFYRLEILRK